MEDTRFERVAEAVFQRYARVWKPQTLAVNRSYLRRQILPAFAQRQIADITRQEVRRWFASLRTTPVAADRSLPVLSVILREAEFLGYRPAGSNPCRGIRRYRRKGRERFLSDDEIRRVATTLSAQEVQWPLEVVAVRLLMLTGCRKSEILTLRWDDLDRTAGELRLRDGKVGPRMVPLTTPVLKVLDGIERVKANPWVTRSRKPDACLPDLTYYWNRIQALAGLENVRIHDLRHYSRIRLIPGRPIHGYRELASLQHVA